MTIAEMLDQLAEIRAEIDAQRLAFEEQREALIPAEIRKQLDAIDEEEAHVIDELEEAAQRLASEIKVAVTLEQQTVKGTRLQAVYYKPRISWDTRGLLGYAQAHPEVLTFKREGKPTVAIRRI